MSGSVCNAAGFGLVPLKMGTDVQSAAEVILGALWSANAALRTQAQTMSAHLAIVQSREKFFGNVLEMLDGGSSGAKTSANEEAANSLALSTRQAIATSALALAQESQTSILRLRNRSNFSDREINLLSAK